MSEGFFAEQSAGHTFFKKKTEYVSNVVMAGNPDFDSDSIMNADEKQWRWLGYPESRIVVNPNPSFSKMPRTPWKKEMTTPDTA